MKLKAILILASIFLLSCSSDDDSGSCELQVWGMSSTVSSTNEVYTIEYGPSENDRTEVEVDKETYAYYRGITEDSNPDDCWEGMK